MLQTVYQGIFHLNRISFYFSVTFLVFGLLLAGCSTTVIKDSAPAKEGKSDEAKKKLALDKFLDGVAFENKGDRASAILEFQEAYSLYPSAGICYSLAKNYFMLNKLAPASAYAKEAIKLDSSNIDYYSLLQDIYSSAGYKDSSVTVLEKIIRMDPKNVQARYELAGSYENNRPKQAIAIYNEILALIGNDWSVLTRLVELYEKTNDLKGVLKTIDNLLEVDPANKEVKKFKIDYLYKDKNYTEALKQCDDLLQLYPDDNDVLLKKGVIYFDQKEYVKASEMFTLLISDTSVAFEKRFSIASTMFNLAILDSNLVPSAKKALLSIDKDTTDANVKLLLGGIAEMEHNDSVAAAYFAEVTVLAPWNVEAWLSLCEKYITNKKYDDAVRTLKVAQERFPDNFGILFMLGAAYLEQEKYELAVEPLKKANKQNGRSAEVLHSLGYALSQLDKVTEAISYLERAVLIQPSNTGMMGTLASMYEKSGDFRKTDSLYLVALSIDSTDALINNNYAYSLSQRKIKLDEALHRVTLALAKDSLNSSYLDTKGWVYYQMGDYNNAVIWIEKALAVNGDKSVLWDHLGDAYFRAEKVNKAKDAWQKALEYDKGNKQILEKIEKGLI